MGGEHRAIKRQHLIRDVGGCARPAYACLEPQLQSRILCHPAQGVGPGETRPGVDEQAVDVIAHQLGDSADAIANDGRARRKGFKDDQRTRLHPLRGGEQEVIIAQTLDDGLPRQAG